MAIIALGFRVSVQISVGMVNKTIMKHVMTRIQILQMDVRQTARLKKTTLVTVFRAIVQ